MIKKLSSRALILLITSITLLCFGYLGATHYIQQLIIENEVHTLAQESKTIQQDKAFIQTIQHNIWNDTAAQHLKIWENNTNTSLSVMTYSGQVLSQNGPELSINSPEIQSAKKNGKLGYQLHHYKGQLYLFVAFPFKSGQTIVGFGRMTIPYHQFSETIQRLQTLVTIIFIVLAGLLGLLIYILYRERYRPIHTLLPVLKRMIKHPEKKAVIINESNDLKELYNTINQLLSDMNQTYLAYQNNKQQLTSLMNELQIGVFVIENDRVTLMNPIVKKWFHLNPQCSATYLDCFAQTTLLPLIQQSLKEEKNITAELHLTQPHEYIFEVALHYSSGQLLGTIYNITELRQLQTMQEDFVSNISHELKTPTTSIIGFIETLKDGAIDQPEVAREFLDIMESDANRLQSLIQEIIQLSRNGFELTDDDLIQLSPKDWIDHLLKQYHHMIEQKHLHVHVHCQTDTTIETYPYYFKPIIKNLVENAILYNKPNGSITIKLTQTAHHYHIIIKDSGIGIAAHDVDRIFERFYRSDKSRNREFGGTGLGLSIVKHYTEVLHGKVDVHSQLGIGTTFQLSFPLIQKAESH